MNDEELGGGPTPSVVATITGSTALTDAAASRLRELPREVSAVEVLGDGVRGDGGRAAAARLRELTGRRLLYTLGGEGSDGSGGAGATRERRTESLLAAAAHHDYIDLDADLDLHRAALDAIPPDRRVVTLRGVVRDVADLSARLARLRAVGARIYRLTPRADTVRDALLPMRLLASDGGTDVTAYATGPAGMWTRVLAGRYGARLVFGSVDVDEQRGSTGGEIPLWRLTGHYRLGALPEVDQIFGLIGGWCGASLAPLVFNTAFEAVGLSATYLPFVIGEFALTDLQHGFEQLGLPLRGVTVVAPYKQTALTTATAASRLALRASAANLLIRRESGWWADNEGTDVVSILEGNGIAVAGRQIAVVGVGGAGRAAAVGLSDAGARVTLVNRTAANGARVAASLGLPFVPLADFDPSRYAVLVHATPVVEQLLFPIDRLTGRHVVFDLNYRTGGTPLVRAARAGGQRVCDGHELLVVELARQFQLMTGRRMPVAPVRAALGLTSAAAGPSAEPPAEPGPRAEALRQPGHA